VNRCDYVDKELYVVDESGTIYDTLDNQYSYVKLKQGDKVLRKGALEYLQDTTDIKYHFIKINPVAWSEISIKYPIINQLVYYLGYMDNILSYRNGKFIKLKDIANICKISESTAKRQLKGLVEDDVIHKVKDVKENTTYLVINPWVCMRGRRIYKTLYNEFKSSNWQNECEEWDT